MNRHLSVTIGIPVFNGGLYLGKAIESALAQSHRDVEVIVYCDGCTDSSSVTARRYAASDKRVRVIECPENKGLGASRNAIIEAAGGDYIAFLDSDDILAPHAVKTALSVAERENAEMVRYAYCRFANRVPAFSMAGSETIFDTRDEIKKTALSIFDPSIDGGRFAVGGSACTCLYRLAWLKECGLCFDADRRCPSEDFLFNFECALAASKIVVLSGTLYGYRRNSASKTHSVDPEFAITSERYCNIVEKLCRRVVEPRRAAVVARKCMAEMILSLGKNVVSGGLSVEDQRSWFDRQTSSPYIRNLPEWEGDRGMGILRRIACRAFCAGQFRFWRMLVLGREIIRLPQKD